MPLLRIFAAIVFALVSCGGAAMAEGKSFRLSAASELIDNGAMKFLLPRFSLKTGVRIELSGDEADASLSTAGDGQPMFQSADGVVYRLTTPGAANPHVERFRDWLASEIGQRAVASVVVDGVNPYGSVEIAAVVETKEVIEGDVLLGEEIALRRCGRCHVISQKNRFGGIGSTPSFGALKTLPGWRERFGAFWTLNPHPAFTQIEDVTEPFDPQRPSPIAPLELTLDELDALMAFVMSIKPKDLGGALILQ